MFPKTVSFLVPCKPTTLNFAKPACRLAFLFCGLVCKETLSVADILAIQRIGEELGFFLLMIPERR